MKGRLLTSQSTKLYDTYAFKIHVIHCREQKAWDRPLVSRAHSSQSLIKLMLARDYKTKLSVGLPEPGLFVSASLSFALWMWMRCTRVRRRPFVNVIKYSMPIRHCWFEFLPFMLRTKRCFSFIYWFNGKFLTISLLYFLFCFVLLIGCLDSHRSPNDSYHSSACYIKNTALQCVIWQCKHLAIACQSGSARWPRVLHVSSKFGLVQSNWEFCTLRRT